MSLQQIPTGARLAAAGAKATTESVFGSRSRGDKTANAIFPAVLLLALAVAVSSLGALIVWSLVEAWPRLDWNLVTNGPSRIHPETAGYRPALLGSLYLIVGVMALIIPLGVGAAIYLEEYADRTRWYNRAFELNIQNLAGVPSIVFGILGLAYIARAPLDLGFTVAAGSITLALLVLPTVIIAAREAIRAVPSSIRQASLALGATQWQTIWRQVLPAAMSGILTGVILAVSRAVGEAAPLLLVGAAVRVSQDPSFFDGRYSALPVQIFTYSTQAQHELQQLASAGIVVMLGFVLLMNAAAIWLRDRYEQKW
jgi:phosphate transport system permease protein